MEMNNNGAYILCSSSFKLKYFFKYPFRYGIQLFTGSRMEHAATYLLGSILEGKLHGVIKTDYSTWLGGLEPQINAYMFQLLNPLSDDECVDMLEFYQNASTSKYNIIEFIFAKIPLLKLIKFPKDKYQFCDKIYLRGLQEIGRIPADIDCARLNPDQVPDLLSAYNLIGGRLKIK